MGDVRWVQKSRGFETGHVSAEDEPRGGEEIARVLNYDCNSVVCS